MEAEQLVDMFPEQTHQFLAKAYDCVVRYNSSGQMIMSRSNPDSYKSFVCDSYFVRCLQKFHCTALEMGREMLVVHSDIPVDLLSMLISGVGNYPGHLGL